MRMYSRILVPLDGSYLSERAIKPALEIAQRRKAKLFLCRSHEPTILSPAAKGFVNQNELHQKEKEDIETYLKSQLPSEYDNCETAILTGEAAEAVLSFAEKESIELIVLTTHGDSGFGRWLLGSVAERITRHSPCPVLSIGQKTLKRLEQELTT
jgi:nucleotide-binding universal stress UspA family protein